MDIVTLGAAKQYTKNSIAGLEGREYRQVDTKPAVGEKGVIYIVKNGNENDLWIYLNNEWVQLDSVDLSGYAKKETTYTKQEVDNLLANVLLFR